MFGMVNFGSIITDSESEQQQIGIEFVKLQTWNEDGLSRAVTTSSTNNQITIPNNGDYKVDFTASFKGTNERIYTLALFQDGVEVSEIRAERYYGKNLVTGDLSFTGTVNVSSAPSVLDVRVKCDVSEANVVIVQSAILTVIELPPTTPDISCKVTKSADQAIPNSISTIATWNLEDYDTDNMHDNVTNNSRITVKTAGKYSVMAQFEWESNSTGKRIIDIMKNGVALGKANYLASGSSQHTVSFVGDCVVNDIFEVRLFQDSGGSLDFLNNITYFEAHKIN